MTSLPTMQSVRHIFLLIVGRLVTSLGEHGQLELGIRALINADTLCLMLRLWKPVQHEKFSSD